MELEKSQNPGYGREFRPICEELNGGALHLIMKPVRNSENLLVSIRR